MIYFQPWIRATNGPSGAQGLTARRILDLAFGRCNNKPLSQESALSVSSMAYYCALTAETCIFPEASTRRQSFLVLQYSCPTEANVIHLWVDFAYGKQLSEKQQKKERNNLILCSSGLSGQRAKFSLVWLAVRQFNP